MPVISRSHTGVTSNLKTTGVPGSKTLAIQQGTETTSTVVETFSFGQAIAEAQRGAMFAQAQLAGDIERIEATNRERKAFGELVIDVARAATGKNPGSTPRYWREHLASSDDRIFKNTFKDIAYILESCAENDTRFEIECYDIGNLYVAAHFVDRKLLKFFAILKTQ